MKPKLVLTGKRLWTVPAYSQKVWMVKDDQCLLYVGNHMGGWLYEYRVQYRMEAQNNS